MSRQFMYHAGEITDEHAENGKVKSSPVCHLVSQIVLLDERTLTYEYDNEERITKVIDSVDGEWVYTYDALGQLLTEQHKAVGAESYTTVNAMTYDNYGNILTKNGVVYGYGDEDWKDLLTSYNGHTITYDLQGNPLSYCTNLLEWEKGRQLKKLTKPDGTVITYTYNANGIRTSKTVGTTKHTYVLDGTKILSETYGAHTVYAHYDNEGSICGITYNSTPYYFLKNLQGDIIAITDENGDVVARYRYDAWGKVLSVTDQDGAPITSPNNIANINPYRYRGYYYDRETGLYYLQSRYYDPETGRFINADAPEITGLIFLLNGILSANLFAYCLNSSVNNSDAIGFISTQQLANLLSVTAIFSMFLQYWVANVGKGLALASGHVAIKATPIVTRFFFFKPWLIPAIVAAVVVIFIAIMALYVNKWINNRIHNIVIRVSKKYGKAKGNSGKSNPNDLKRGMTKNQAGMFQRLIEEYKRYNGMPPNFNLPWEILVALADEAKEQFK